MNSKRISGKQAEDVEHGLVAHKRSSARFVEESEPSFSTFQVSTGARVAERPQATGSSLLAVYQATVLSLFLPI